MYEQSTALLPQTYFGIDSYVTTRTHFIAILAELDRIEELVFMAKGMTQLQALPKTRAATVDRQQSAIVWLSKQVSLIIHRLGSGNGESKGT